MNAFDRFVGIHYLDRGRSLQGCDCWGLVWLVYRELLGVDLPCYSSDYVTGADREAIARLIAGQLDAWRAIPNGEERSFDAVLMREGNYQRHIGIVTEPGMLLHVERGSTSRIERYGYGFLAARVAGFYRPGSHE